MFKKNKIIQFTAGLTLAAFISAQMQVKSPAKEFYLSPASSFVPRPEPAAVSYFSAGSTPLISKKWKQLLFTSIVAFGLVPAVFNLPLINQAVAQDGQEVEGRGSGVPITPPVETALSRIFGRLALLKARPDKAEQYEGEILNWLREAQRLDHPLLIEHIYTHFNSTALDYDMHPDIYDQMINSLIALIRSHQNMRYPKMGIRKIILNDENKSMMRLVYELPQFIRVSDIPKNVMEDMVRRLHLEAQRIRPPTREDEVESRLAAQSFRAYARAVREGLTPYDAAKIDEVVRDIQTIVRLSAPNRRRVLYGLVQSMADLPVDGAQGEQVNRWIQTLERFAVSQNYWNEQERVEGYFVRVRQERSKRLYQTSIVLTPSNVKTQSETGAATVAPETTTSSSNEANQENEPEVGEPANLFLLFLSAGALLAGLISIIILFLKDKVRSKSDNFNLPFNGNVTLNPDIVDIETIEPDSMDEQKPLPRLQQKTNPPFLLLEAEAWSEIGLVRKALYYENNRPTRQHHLVEKGPFLIEVVPRNDPRYAGQQQFQLETVRTAYFYANYAWSTISVIVKGDYVIEVLPVQDSPIGQVHRSWFVRNGGQEAEGPVYMIPDGDLLIDPNPLTEAELDPKRKLIQIIHRNKENAYRAYSVSKEDWIQVVPFRDSEGKIYWLSRVLGQGGMGAVYETWDSHLGRDAAMKVILNDGLTFDENAVIRFELEAESTAAIQHENVVRIHRLHKKIPYFYIMEKLNGDSLEGLIKNRPRLNLEEVLEVGIQTARGLEAIHAAGILHRDLKPDNLFWVRDGSQERVVLTDFGLVLKFREGIPDDQRLTVTGEVVGTPQYMAPEQALGYRDLDDRVDIYALGAILYKITTGITPYSGRGVLQIMSKLVDPEKKPKPVRELNPSVPPELEALIERAMAKDKNDRYMSVTEIRRELESLKRKYKKKTPIVKRVLPKTKKDAKIIAAITALIAAALFLIGRSRPDKSKTPDTETPPTAQAPEKNERLFEEPLSSWSQLQRMGRGRALEVLEQESGKITRFLRNSRDPRPVPEPERTRLNNDLATRHYFTAYLKLQQALAEENQAIRLSLFRQALRKINEAIRLNGNQAEYYLLLGRIAAELGDTEELRRAIDSLRKLGAENQPLQEKLRRLERQMGQAPIDLPQIKPFELSA